MKFFELRAMWVETYDCPDDGLVEICDKYETIAFSTDTVKLQAIANELEKGYKNNNWSLKRCNELRKLYSGYDDFRETEYKIIDVSDFILY